MKFLKNTLNHKSVVSFLIAISFVFPYFTEAALPAGFEFQTIASGFNLPSTIAFTNDGRIFVAEKGGAVKVIKNGSVLATPLITLTDINTYGDRGLIGMAVDPSFSSNGYVYLLYTYENTPGLNIAGPKTARLLRVTVVGDIASESSKVVLVGTIGGNIVTPSCEDYAVTSDCIPSDSLSHSGGGLRFGPDGKLYATLGDGASFDFADPKSLRSQNLDSLAGKMLRINTDGTAPADNPYYNGSNIANRSKVYALGLRNGFRFNFRPSNGKIFLGDVGWNIWEEVDLINAGGNYGWPCKEGPVNTPGGLGCTASSTTTDPIYSYVHDVNGAGSVTSGAFPTGSAYPASYLNTMFFGDYAQNWIKMMNLDANNQVVSVQNFGVAADDTNGPVEFVTGPEGNVYFLSIYTGELKKITHTSGNRQPIVSIGATPTSGLAPLTVNFSGAGSTDPDGNPITFLWNFGDNATSSLANPTHTYNVNGTYIATLSVMDNLGGISTKNVTITVGNQAPSVSINSPASGSLYLPNQTIQLNGSGTDPETGSLSGNALSWRVILHHNIHIHVIYTATGTTPSFVAPDHNDPDVYVEVELTATDPAGLQKVTSINMYLNNGSSGGNAILNPSVETPDSNNAFQPESWLTGFFGVLNPVFTYPVAGQDGTKAVKLSVSGYVSGDAKWYFSPINVNENTQYKFSDYYKSNVTSTLTAQIGYANGTYSYLDLGSLPASPVNWTKVENIFTTPVGAKTVVVFHALAANGELTTDNFFLGLNSSSTPDTIPPTVSITSPTSGQTIGGNFNFTATSTDNVAVAGVTFILDGVATSTEKTTTPYTLTLNTNTLSNGTHSIAGRSRDTSNNIATSTAVTFTVLNSVATTTSGNLIVNGAMETPSTTTAGNPYAWGKGGWGTNTRTFTYPVAGQVGNGATVAITAYTNGDAKWYPNDVLVTPGKIYNLSWYYKSNATTTSELRYTSTGGTVTYPILNLNVPPSATWKKLSYTVTVPAGIAKLSVFHILTKVGTLSTDEFVLTTDATSTPDTIPPTVSITSPTSGQTIGGNFNFTATSTDNVAVAGVTFILDGVATSTEKTTTPYTLTLNTNTLSNGTHSIAGRSRDTSNNIATSTAVTFTVLNSTSTPDTTAPQVVITSPAASSTVSELVSLTASSTDNVAVSNVQFKLDGVNFGLPLTTESYTISWNSASSTNGTHTISAVSTDTGGNKATSTISVNVSNSVGTTSPNLILNGDMETANGTSPLGWFPAGWGSSTKVYNYPVVGVDGNKAINYIVTNYIDGDVKWAFIPVDVSPGTLYRYSDYFKSTTITDIIGQYTLADGSFAYFGLVKEIPGASNWTEISGTFTPPVGVTKVTFFHLISTNGTVHLDNASLVSLGTTTPSTDLTAPIVEFTNPLAGASVNGIVNVTASSTDNVGVTYVVYALNGDIISPNLTTSPYSYAWDTTTRANGSYILKATTHDAAGNNSNIQIPITINNSSGTTTTGNLIDNPSFEQTAVNGDPASWSRGGWGTNNVTFSYPVPGRTTAKAAKVNITSYIDGDRKWYFSPKGVMPGQQYIFSDYYMSDISSDVTARYTLLDGTFIYAGLANLPAAATWTQYQTTLIPPAGATALTVFHSISGGGNLTVDDYSLQLVSTTSPTTFSEGMVSLTFDDGWVSHYNTVLPMLDTANIDGTFGIITQETIGAGNEVNRINNPSLETVGANGDPQDWLRGGWGTNTRTYTYPVPGQSGTNAAKVTIANYTSGDAKWFFKDATIIPGQNYIFSNYYMSDVPSTVDARFNVGSTTYQYKFLATLPPAASWTQYSVNIPIPSNAQSVTIFHSISANGNLTIDNYDLTRSQVYVTPAQVQAIKTAGHEVSSHTRTHQYLTTLPLAQMQSEIIDSKTELVNMGVGPIDTLIYPYGDYNDAVVSTTQGASYIGARGVDRGFNDKNTDKFKLKIQQVDATTTPAQIEAWIDVAEQTKTWLILMYHQVGSGGEELSTTPAILQSTINYLSSKSMPKITMKQGILMMN